MPETSSSSRAALLSLVALLVAGLAWWLWPRDASDDEPTATPQAAADPSGPLRRADAAREPIDPTALRHAAKASITGMVRSRDRGPLADAQVCAWAIEEQLRGLATATPTCVRSDREGRYRIEGLWPVRTQLSASAAGHIPRMWNTQVEGVTLHFVSLAAGRTREGIDFELEGGGVEISGVVRDLGGGEIEGAQVMSEDVWGGTPRSGRAYAQSDAEGRFTLWVAPGEVSLRADAEGYALASARSHAPTAMAEIFMTPESVLVGQVVDAASGEPLPDVLVAIGRGVADTRSDAEGHFRFGKLGPGVYKPIVRDDELFGVVDAKVHLGLAQTSEPIVIRAHRMAAVRGMVVIAESDRPCPLGNVALRQLADRSIRYYATIEDGGQVTLRGVEPGTYEVSVACTEFLAREDYPELVVGGESLDGLVWPVDAGRAIRGRVVDASGAGVANASVFARPIVEGEQARGQTSSARDEATSDAGSFELRGLLAGRYELSVMSDEPGPEQPLQVELPADADLDDVRIELLASGSIVGRVVDESGVPLPGIDVSAKPLGKWGGGDTRSDDGGHFVLEHLRAGEVRVKAGRGWDDMRAPGTSDDDVQGELVSVVAGERVEVELVVESRNGVIRGRVLDEQGSPIDDAFISAERMSDSATASASRSRSLVRWAAFGRETPILSEVDGSFTIERLSAGRYVVRAHRRGGGEALLEGVELGASIELTIAPTSLLAGRLVVPGGEPPERFTITVEDDKQGVSESDLFFRTQGRWQLGELPPGSYRVTATGHAGTASIEVELGAGERREDLELELEPLVTLRGRLVDIDTREPVPGMIVSVGRSGPTFSSDGGPNKHISDTEGHFEVEHAPTGKVTISVRPRSFSSTTRYGFTTFARVLPSDPSVQDLGDVEIVASRVLPNQAVGELGFETAPAEPGTEPEQVRLRVGLIRPGGPASATTLALGDEIEQVDGKSVVGVDAMRFYTLTAIPPGTTIELTIAGGKRVSITADPPLE